MKIKYEIFYFILISVACFAVLDIFAGIRGFPAFMASVGACLLFVALRRKVRPKSH